MYVLMGPHVLDDKHANDGEMLTKLSREEFAVIPRVTLGIYDTL